jgi:hypothetical protein
VIPKDAIRMPYLMPYQINPQVAQRYATLHAASKNAAMQFEQGQAEQPLSTRIRALCPPMDQPSPLCVGLVPHSAADRAEALRWLLGDLQETGAAEAVSNRLVELRITPVEHHIPKACAGPAGAGHDVVLLQVAGHPQIWEVTVLLAPDLQGLLADFEMENQLRARSDLLLVAAPTNAEFAGAGTELLRDLIEAIPAWAPLITAGPGKAAWASELGSGLRGVAFPPMHSNDSPPSLIGDPEDIVRRLLHLVGRGRSLQSLAHALVDGYQQRIREWQSIKNPALSPGAPQLLTEIPACKALKEQVKAATQEIAAPQTPRLRLAGNDQDPLMQMVESALDKLGPNHLQREPARRKVNLRLAGDWSEKLTKILTEGLQMESAEEVCAVKERLSACRITTQTELNKLSGAGISLVLPPVNQPDPPLKVEIDYRGDLRKNNLWTWIMYARFELMALTGFLTIGSMYGIGISRSDLQNNEALRFFALGIFCFLVWKGRHDFKCDEHEKIESELEKLRTQLKSRCEAIVADARTLRRHSLNSWLGQCRQQLLARIDAVETELLKSENQRRKAAHQAAQATHAHAAEEYGRASAQIAAHTPLLNALNTALTAFAQHDDRAALLQASTPAPTR